MAACLNDGMPEGLCVRWPHETVRAVVELAEVCVVQRSMKMDASAYSESRNQAINLHAILFVRAVTSDVKAPLTF